MPQASAHHEGMLKRNTPTTTDKSLPAVPETAFPIGLLLLPSTYSLLLLDCLFAALLLLLLRQAV